MNLVLRQMYGRTREKIFLADKQDGHQTDWWKTNMCLVIIWKIVLQCPRGERGGGWVDAGVPTLDNQYHPPKPGIKHTRHCAKYLQKKFGIISKTLEIHNLMIF